MRRTATAAKLNAREPKARFPTSKEMLGCEIAPIVGVENVGAAAHDPAGVLFAPDRLTQGCGRPARLHSVRSLRADEPVRKRCCRPSFLRKSTVASDNEYYVNSQTSGSAQYPLSEKPRATPSLYSSSLLLLTRREQRQVTR